MSQRMRSGGDQGKAPIFVASHGDSSSNDETTTTGEWDTLQSHFECEGDNTKPTSSIPMETDSKR